MDNVWCVVWLHRERSVTENCPKQKRISEGLNSVFCAEASTGPDCEDLDSIFSWLNPLLCVNCVFVSLPVTHIPHSRHKLIESPIKDSAEAMNITESAQTPTCDHGIQDHDVHRIWLLRGEVVCIIASLWLPEEWLKKVKGEVGQRETLCVCQPQCWLR